MHKTRKTHKTYLKPIKIRMIPEKSYIQRMKIDIKPTSTHQNICKMCVCIHMYMALYIQTYIKKHV